jgi:hypothetical protein
LLVIAETMAGPDHSPLTQQMLRKEVSLPFRRSKRERNVLVVNLAVTVHSVTQIVSLYLLQLSLDNWCRKAGRIGDNSQGENHEDI